MDIATSAQRLAVAADPLLAWAARRAAEKSTIVGLAGWLATAGFAAAGSQVTSHAALIVTLAGALSTALITTSTKPRPAELLLTDPIPADIHPLALPAPADPLLAEPAPSKENDMSTVSTILIEVETDVLDFLKSAGKELKSFALTETAKLVAEVKATYVGTVAMNLIQVFDSQEMTAAEKFDAVVTTVVPLINKLVASGGVSKAIVSVEDFARELVQSAYNDLKAALAKVAGEAATAIAAKTGAVVA